VGSDVVATGAVVPVLGAATDTDEAALRPAFRKAAKTVEADDATDCTEEVMTAAFALVVATLNATFTPAVCSRWRPDRVVAVTDTMVMDEALTLKVDAMPFLKAAA